MKIFTKYFVTIVTIFSLLPAISGITIYHHICSENHTHYVTIFHKTKCQHLQLHKQYQQNNCNNNCYSKNHSQQNYKSETKCCYEFTEFKNINADTIKTQNIENSIKSYISKILSLNELFQNNTENKNNYNIFIKENFTKKIIKYIHYQSNPKNSKDSFC